jgi:hypothetical protein
MVHEITLQNTTANWINSLIESIILWWKKISCPEEENYFLIN